MSVRKFRYAILGGTFDHLHVGHRHFISYALARTQKATIGITTASLYFHKQYAESIESYESRKTSVEDFLKQISATDRTAIIPLTDIYGNCLEKKDIDAIFVTPDSQHTAEIMNQKRIEKNWPPMDIVCIPLIIGNDKKIISSLRIRSGEINRLGTSYMSLFKKRNRYLPQYLREHLKKPIGKILDMNEPTLLSELSDTILITVGDIVTAFFFQQMHQPTICIFDYKNDRHDITDKNILLQLPHPDYSVQNKTAEISLESVNALHHAMDTYMQTGDHQAIAVTGEEDLLTIPSILLSPLQTIVVYGQKEYGIISVRVTEEIKEQIQTLLMQFE